jgi:hypothetical protein
MYAKLLPVIIMSDLHKKMPVIAVYTPVMTDNKEQISSPDSGLCDLEPDLEMGTCDCAHVMGVTW